MSSEAISILLIVVTVIFSASLIGFLLGRYIYRRVHNLPTGECGMCHKNKKQLLKEYHKFCACELQK